MVKMPQNLRKDERNGCNPLKDEGKFDENINTSSNILKMEQTRSHTIKVEQILTNKMTIPQNQCKKMNLEQNPHNYYERSPKPVQM